MKNTIIMVFVGLMLVGGIAWTKQQNNDDTEMVENNIGHIQTTPTNVPEEISVEWDGEVVVEDRNYVYSVRKNIQTKNLRLIPNYDKKIMTSDFLATTDCQLLVNGGFYDTNFRPLGWFVADGVEESREKTSSLFNGFVAIDQQRNIRFDFDKPKDEIEFGLQSGPMLVYQGRALKLSMARDKNARRVVMVEEKSGQVAFFAFYTKMSDQLGPLMADLPALVLLASRGEDFDPVSAINLDGGSASVFWNSEVFLEESSSVGSWWCEAKDVGV